MAFRKLKNTHVVCVLPFFKKELWSVLFKTNLNYRKFKIIYHVNSDSIIVTIVTLMIKPSNNQILTKRLMNKKMQVSSQKSFWKVFGGSNFNLNKFENLETLTITFYF